MRADHMQGSGLNLTYSEARPIADLSEWSQLYPVSPELIISSDMCLIDCDK
jgi:hypothetical protein